MRRQLAAQLHMDADEAEKWIVDLIRTTQIDARLDAKTSSLQMMQPDTTVYQQINDNTRDLASRTRNLVEGLESLGAGAEASRGRGGGGGGGGGARAE